MSSPTTVMYGPHHFPDGATGIQLYPAAGSVTDTTVAAAAAIATTKLRHRHTVKFNQANSSATTETRAIFVANAAGTVLKFDAGSIAIAVGVDTVTVDLKKNGSSVLTSVITLNSSSTARTVATGTLSGTSFVAGDWYEVVVTANHSSGTLPTGVFARLIVDEDPA